MFSFQASQLPQVFLVMSLIVNPAARSWFGLAGWWTDKRFFWGFWLVWNVGVNLGQVGVALCQLVGLEHVEVGCPSI